AIRVTDDLLSGRHDDCGRSRRHGTRLVAEESDMATVRLRNDVRGCRPSAVLRAVGFGLTRGFHEPLIVVINVAYGWFACACLHGRLADFGAGDRSDRQLNAGGGHLPLGGTPRDWRHG